MPDYDNTEAERRMELVAEKTKQIQAGIDERMARMGVIEGVAPAPAPKAKATPKAKAADE